MLLDSNSIVTRQRLVENWLTDLRRRGAKLHSVHRSRVVLNLSFEGRDQSRYKIKIDLESQDIRIELNRPKWKWVKCERYLLSPGSLRLLAKRTCPVPEGRAVVTVDFLGRVSLLCDAHRRLLRERDPESYTQASIESICRMQSELRPYLIPEEQPSDNPSSGIELDSRQGVNIR
jgi:hypothetical protein